MLVNGACAVQVHVPHDFINLRLEQDTFMLCAQSVEAADRGAAVADLCRVDFEGVQLALRLDLIQDRLRCRLLRVPEAWHGLWQAAFLQILDIHLSRHPWPRIRSV